MAIGKQDEFNGLIKRIFEGGKIKKINWGAESESMGWKTWTDNEKLDYAIELACAMNQAAEFMQNERNQFSEEARLKTQLAEQAQNNLMIQKSITSTNIVNTNQQNQQHIENIQALERRIRELNTELETYRNANGSMGAQDN